MLIGVLVVNIFLCDFLLIDSPPGIDDVGQHEGDDKADVEHGAQRELAGA